MADHCSQLLVAIEEVKELAFSQDNVFHRELARKVVEMRDYYQLEELASASSVHDFDVCVTGLHLAVKRVKIMMRRCLDGDWIQAILQMQTNEVEVLEILIDLDRYCKQMCNAMLQNRKGDSSGSMNKDDIICTPAKYKGFEELMRRREDITDTYFNEILQRLQKEIDAAEKNGKSGESRFIACILQKLKGGTGTGDSLDVKWTEAIHGSYLGQGAYGCVIESNLFGETLAFKNLVTKSREAEIQASLHHPNIVQVLCCLQPNEGRHMVMELMTTDLRRFLRRFLKENQRGLALSVAIDVILQIARAMYYMHGQGVAHRDLKGANIMVKVVDSCDGYVQVKVGDFGLAKIGLEAKDRNVGTAHYRAPEISANPEGMERDLAKADVYSFALTCYHILTCQEPFTTIGADHLQTEVVELEKPLQFSECCPSELVSLITSCWATDPMKRPDFGMICNELQHLQVVFTRSSENNIITSGPNFIGEGSVNALVEAPDDNLKYGIMPVPALEALKLGIIQESNENFVAALKKYNEAYEIHPKNVCILARRGHVKWRLGNFLEALDDLNEAFKLDPEYRDVLSERGFVKWKTGDRVGALEDLDKFTTFQPKNSFGFYIRGRVKYSMNLFKEALADFDEAHSLGVNSPNFFSTRAYTKMALGDYRGAIADFDEIYPLSLCSRATAKAYLGDVEGALGDYDKALKMGPVNPFLFRARADFKLSIFDCKGAMEESNKASQLTYPSVKFQDLVFRVQLRSRSEDFQGSLKELNTVKDHEARNPGFWALQGFLKSLVDDMQGALCDVEKANKLKPNDALFLSWRGQIKLVLDDGVGAAVDFKKVRELDSGNVARILKRAKFRFSLCDHHGTIRDLNMLLEFDPLNWDALHSRGWAKEMLNDLEGALTDYTEASTINPNSNMISTSLGVVKGRLNDIVGALAHLNNVDDTRPIHASTYFARGQMRAILEDYGGSLQDLDTAHSLEPHNTLVLFERALVKVDIEDLDGALDDQQRAISLDPDNDNLLRGSQFIRHLLGDRLIFARYLIFLLLMIILEILQILGLVRDPYERPRAAVMAWLRSRMRTVMECLLYHLYSKFFITSSNSSLCKVDDTITIDPVILHRTFIGLLIAGFIGWCVGYFTCASRERILTSKMNAVEGPKSRVDRESIHVL